MHCENEEENLWNCPGADVWSGIEVMPRNGNGQINIIVLTLENE
jgi:hypothetical protein